MKLLQSTTFRRFSTFDIYDDYVDEVIDTVDPKTERVAAEGNPIRFYYAHKLISEKTADDRMIKLYEQNPKTINILGMFPQVYEEDVDGAQEAQEKQIIEEDEQDIKLDKVSIDEAVEIIYEMNKDRLRS
eukprot:CAMPEP_0205816770 /NCGR_PEP_ID=MMETSP0205-20121125/23248_1 /ASSEMBLY_ACC=CAM_ASM_000278 /TAXON_ID=36767 /ORGANISM="Euplotes focardii, Strain TN1" /LENGTH=129 /DNA_ID=CAMNT_0053105829 /DNA_START=46 /DNA_END=435 /DNA_ORIENTATION=-